MGWSCNEAAMDRLNMILAANNEESQNTWSNEKGQRAFFEQSNREHNDGAITGTVYKFVDESCVVPAGSVRIEGSGKCVRFPLLSKAMRSASKNALPEPAPMFQVI